MRLVWCFILVMMILLFGLMVNCVVCGLVVIVLFIEYVIRLMVLVVFLVKMILLEGMLMNVVIVVWVVLNVLVVFFVSWWVFWCMVVLCCL